MSAFAVIFEDSNTPGNPITFNRVMERLSHRGPDGSDVSITGNISMGHWHFWTTPEEVGERQPLELDGLPFKIVLDGRLDNRADLLVKLNINSGEGKTVSDAALILRSYVRWGEDCLRRFIGEYAFVIFNEPRGELFCARDPVGERTLFYCQSDRWLAIASEPWAVGGAYGSTLELNESAVALYFAMQMPKDGQTMFKNIHELLPAHAMRVDRSGQRTWRYWQPNLPNRSTGRSNEDYAEEFRHLLEESIRCRLRSTTPVGVLMSGGLDSTSIACLAGRMLAPETLTTISYVFDELKECDERQYIDAVKEQYRIHSVEVPCDDAWPLKDWNTWPKNMNCPGGNPFRLLNERSYSSAQRSGLRVLLTGEGGDQLYRAGANWFADLLGEGRLLEAFRELGYVRSVGLHRFLKSGFLRRAARRLLDAIPGGSHLHRRQSAPDWLSTLSRNFVLKKEVRPVSLSDQYAGMLGISLARSYSSEIYYASRYKVELRHPYRDHRLIEFALGLPAYQLYAKGMHKYILRAAMQGILPGAIGVRRGGTSLNMLFFRGIEREKTLLQACSRDPDAAWRKFINPDWLILHGGIAFASNKLGHEGMVPWLCASYDAWYKSFITAITPSWQQEVTLPST